jgi:hypothetical protein
MCSPDLSQVPGCSDRNGGALVGFPSRRRMRGQAETVQARPPTISWARLLKRVFDIDMQHCPNCGGGELEIIAAILERPVIEKILTHLGLDPQPPPKGRAGEAGQDFAT